MPAIAVALAASIPSTPVETTTATTVPKERATVAEAETRPAVGAVGASAAIAAVGPRSPVDQGADGRAAIKENPTATANFGFEPLETVGSDPADQGAVGAAETALAIRC